MTSPSLGPTLPGVGCGRCRVRAGRVVPALGVRALAPGVPGCAGGHLRTTSTLPPPSTTPVLNLQGDSGRLILWVSRISADLSPTSTNQSVSSDLHRITYWLVRDGGGLARQEINKRPAMTP